MTECDNCSLQSTTECEHCLRIPNLTRFQVACHVVLAVLLSAAFGYLYVAAAVIDWLRKVKAS